MVRCFDFAVQYKAEAFGEAVSNVLVDTVFTTGLYPHYPTIIFAYAHIADTRLPLMRLLVDYHCERFGQHDGMVMEECVARDIPVAFWRKMMERYAGIRNGSVDAEMGAQGCYHRHADGEELEACEVCCRLREGSDVGSDSEEDSEDSEMDSLYGDGGF